MNAAVFCNKTLKPISHNDFQLHLIKGLFKGVTFTSSETLNSDFYAANEKPAIAILSDDGCLNMKRSLGRFIKCEGSYSNAILQERAGPNSQVMVGSTKTVDSQFLLPSNDLLTLSWVINSFKNKTKLNDELILPNLDKKRNVLLISPYGWQKESTNLGLALLAGALKAAGFKVMILDLCRYPMTDSELANTVELFDPFIIGLSVKTAQAKESRRLATVLKGACPKAFIIAGGPHMTIAPEFFFGSSRTPFDFGIMSEGEESFPRLCLALSIEDRILAEGLDGIVFQRSNTMVVNRWRPPEDLSLLPFPDFDVIKNFDWEDFRYPIVSSRGCPYRCIFCCVHMLSGSYRWRSRRPEDIVEELVYAHEKYGIKKFEFWDDNFTMNLDRAKLFCRKLKETGISFSWWCHNGIRADKIDLELAHLMKDAGCTSVAFGIESGTSEVFDSIQKGETLDDVVNAVALLKTAGIKAVGYFIIGLPGDNLLNFIETVRFQRRLKLDHYVYGLLIPYPGTKVWEIVNKRGQILLDITDTQHFGNDLPEISFELPEFPKKEMIIAFYITKFFDLFDTIEHYLQSAASCKVVFLVDEADGLNALTGLFYALFNFKKKLKIYVVYKGNQQALSEHKSFLDASRLFKWSLLSEQQFQRINYEDVSCILSSESMLKKRMLSRIPYAYTLQLWNPIQALKRL
jgi:radical SAM superfamily enzyme YgiQ (UPF0313 family)